MSTPLQNLTQTELLALALEATRHGQSGQSMVYLKEASSRADAGHQALFLLGSEYAQIGLMDDAKQCMARAIERAPDFAIGRFQLGLLCLTSGAAADAEAIWAPLAHLPANHPQAGYLGAFHRGLLHLIRDEFDGVVEQLTLGIGLNLENPALNVDMQRVVDEVRQLQAAQAGSSQAAPAAAPAAEVAAAEEETQHLFLNAYSRGKPH